MTTHQIYDGHGYSSVYDVDDTDPASPHCRGLVATCTCGWSSDKTHPYATTDDQGDTEEVDAQADWWDNHMHDLTDQAVPAALAEQIRSVGRQLDKLIEDDKPMAALAAIRISDGYFARQARDAALRASYLDHSWAQIGEALGISKQAAWERYGKARRDPAAKTTSN
ncbi:hypothetical protein ACWCYY_35105 [Kitasatospora sp. NPDC001664]